MLGGVRRVGCFLLARGCDGHDVDGGVVPQLLSPETLRGNHGILGELPLLVDSCVFCDSLR
jgi:hypothetical protein